MKTTRFINSIITASLFGLAMISSPVYADHERVRTAKYYDQHDNQYERHGDHESHNNSQNHHKHIRKKIRRFHRWQHKHDVAHFHPKGFGRHVKHKKSWRRDHRSWTRHARKHYRRHHRDDSAYFLFGGRYNH